MIVTQLRRKKKVLIALPVVLPLLAAPVGLLNMNTKATASDVIIDPRTAAVTTMLAPDEKTCFALVQPAYAKAMVLKVPMKECGRNEEKDDSLE